jgi:hypothetical protein
MKRRAKPLGFRATQPCLPFFRLIAPTTAKRPRDFNRLTESIIEIALRWHGKKGGKARTHVLAQKVALRLPIRRQALYSLERKPSDADSQKVPKLSRGGLALCLSSSGSGGLILIWIVSLR